MRPGLFGIAVAPDDIGSCELMDTVSGCGDGSWSLMIGVGVDWSAACGTANGSGGDGTD